MDISRAERFQCVSRYPPHIYIYASILLLVRTFKPTFYPELPSDKHHVQRKRPWGLSSTRTPRVRIRFFYLHQPTSDALTGSLETKAASSPLQPEPLARPCQSVTHPPMLTGPATIIEIDATSNPPSPFVSLRAHPLAKEQPFAQHTSLHNRPPCTHLY